MNETTAELISKIKDALDFYSNCYHDVTLTNKVIREKKTDWKTERENLKNTGFIFANEDLHGNEQYIETGIVADKALILLQELEKQLKGN